MRVRLRNLTLCVVALMFAVALPVAGRGVGDEPVRQLVSVCAGQEITVTARKLKIKFVGVLEDSRCPEGVQCIWAGNARIRLKLSGGRGRVANVELNTTNKPRETTYANYTIALVNLVPRAVRDGRPKAGEYGATLAIINNKATGRSSPSDASIKTITPAPCIDR